MHVPKEKFSEQKSLKQTNKQRKTLQIMDLNNPINEFKNIKGKINRGLKGKSTEWKT